VVVAAVLFVVPLKEPQDASTRPAIIEYKIFFIILYNMYLTTEGNQIDYPLLYL
jgi:hypothetical protein